MLRRCLFHILIVISICSALSASAQEVEFTETTVAEEVTAEEAQESSADDENVTATASFEPLPVGEEMVVVEAEEGNKGEVNESSTVATETTSTAASSMIVIPAIEDVYSDMQEETVYNDDHLVCEYSMEGETEEGDYPKVAMIQFDVSDLEMKEDDVGVLVLKAESMKTVGEGAVGVVLMPMTSEWSENSSASDLGLNLLAAILMMAGGDEVDLGQFGINFGGDEIFAFDVSERLKTAEGGRVSFLLMAMGDTDCRVSFKSRETGEGPSLLIVPYPSSAPAA